MRKLAFLFLFSLLFTACTEDKQALNESFYGLIPCADCPGIEYELHLNEDNTFSESLFYLEGLQEAYKADGTYSIIKGDIILLDRGENEGFKNFLIKGENLVILDTEGKEIQGGLADFYVLSKEKPKANLSPDGSSFIVRGNEPFWNIRFGLDNKMYLQGLFSDGEVSLVFTTPEATQLNEHAKSYRIENSELEMDLLITSEPCDDSMADISYTHKVELQLKLDGWDNYQTLQGCGEYDGTHQLNNTWKLVSINGEKLGENNRNTHLQFNMEANSFFGNAGCNNISGDIEHTETTISFGVIASTEMACDNLTAEEKFLATLYTSTYDIQLSKNDLSLSNSENELVFKRIE